MIQHQAVDWIEWILQAQVVLPKCIIVAQDVQRYRLIQLKLVLVSKAQRIVRIQDIQVLMVKKGIHLAHWVVGINHSLAIIECFLFVRFLLINHLYVDLFLHLRHVLALFFPANASVSLERFFLHLYRVQAYLVVQLLDWDRILALPSPHGLLLLHLVVARWRNWLVFAVIALLALLLDLCLFVFQLVTQHLVVG